MSECEHESRPYVHAMVFCPDCGEVLTIWDETYPETYSQNTTYHVEYSEASDE